MGPGSPEEYDDILDYMEGRATSPNYGGLETLDYHVRRGVDNLVQRAPELDPAQARTQLLKDFDERVGTSRGAWEEAVRSLPPEVEERMRADWVESPFPVDEVGAGVDQATRRLAEAGDMVPRVYVEGYTAQRFAEDASNGNAPQVHDLEHMTAQGILVDPEVFDLAHQPIFHEEKRKQGRRDLGYAISIQSGEPPDDDYKYDPNMLTDDELNQVASLGRDPVDFILWKNLTERFDLKPADFPFHKFDKKSLSVLAGLHQATQQEREAAERWRVQFGSVDVRVPVKALAELGLEPRPDDAIDSVKKEEEETVNFLSLDPKIQLSYIESRRSLQRAQMNEATVRDYDKLVDAVVVLKNFNVKEMEKGRREGRVSQQVDRWLARIWHQHPEIRQLGFLRRSDFSTEALNHYYDQYMVLDAIDATFGQAAYFLQRLVAESSELEASAGAALGIPAFEGIPEKGIEVDPAYLAEIEEEKASAAIIRQREVEAGRPDPGPDPGYHWVGTPFHRNQQMNADRIAQTSPIITGMLSKALSLAIKAEESLPLHVGRRGGSVKTPIKSYLGWAAGGGIDPENVAKSANAIPGSEKEILVSELSRAVVGGVAQLFLDPGFMVGGAKGSPAQLMLQQSAKSIIKGRNLSMSVDDMLDAIRAAQDSASLDQAKGLSQVQVYVGKKFQRVIADMRDSGGGIIGMQDAAVGSIEREFGKEAAKNIVNKFGSSFGKRGWNYRPFIAPSLGEFQILGPEHINEAMKQGRLLTTAVRNQAANAIDGVLEAEAGPYILAAAGAATGVAAGQKMKDAYEESSGREAGGLGAHAHSLVLGMMLGGGALSGAKKVAKLYEAKDGTRNAVFRNLFMNAHHAMDFGLRNFWSPNYKMKVAQAVDENLTETATAFLEPAFGAPIFAGSPISEAGRKLVEEATEKRAQLQRLNDAIEGIEASGLKIDPEELGKYGKERNRILGEIEELDRGIAEDKVAQAARSPVDDAIQEHKYKMYRHMEDYLISSSINPAIPKGITGAARARARLNDAFSNYKNHLDQLLGSGRLEKSEYDKLVAGIGQVGDDIKTLSSGSWPTRMSSRGRHSGGYNSIPDHLEKVMRDERHLNAIVDDYNSIIETGMGAMAGVTKILAGVFPDPKVRRALGQAWGAHPDRLSKAAGKSKKIEFARGAIVDAMDETLGLRHNAKDHAWFQLTREEKEKYANLMIYASERYRVMYLKEAAEGIEVSRRSDYMPHIIKNVRRIMEESGLSMGTSESILQRIHGLDPRQAQELTVPMLKAMNLGLEEGLLAQLAARTQIHNLMMAEKKLQRMAVKRFGKRVPDDARPQETLKRGTERLLSIPVKKKLPDGKVEITETYYTVPTHVDEALSEAIGFIGETSPLLAPLKAANSVFRTLFTIPSPGYYSRNFQGDAIRAMMTGIDNPSRATEAAVAIMMPEEDILKTREWVRKIADPVERKKAQNLLDRNLEAILRLGNQKVANWAGTGEAPTIFEVTASLRKGGVAGRGFTAANFGPSVMEMISEAERASSRGAQALHGLLDPSIVGGVAGATVGAVGAASEGTGSWEAAWQGALLGAFFGGGAAVARKTAPYMTGLGFGGALVGGLTAEEGATPTDLASRMAGGAGLGLMGGAGLRVGATYGKLPTPTKNALPTLFKFGAGVQDKQEEYFRMMGGIDQLAKGNSVKAAIEMADFSQFNYRRQKVLDASLREIQPFWKWSRNIIPHITYRMAMDPAYFSARAKTVQAFETESRKKGGPWEDLHEYNDWLISEYSRRNVLLEMPFTLGADVPIMVKYQDGMAADMNVLKPWRHPEQFLGSFSPLFRGGVAALEKARDWYKNAPPSKRVPAPRFVSALNEPLRRAFDVREESVLNLGFVFDQETLARIGTQDAPPGLTMLTMPKSALQALKMTIPGRVVADVGDPYAIGTAKRLFTAGSYFLGAGTVGVENFYESLRYKYQRDVGEAYKFMKEIDPDLAARTRGSGVGLGDEYLYSPYQASLMRDPEERAAEDQRFEEIRRAYIRAGGRKQGESIGTWDEFGLDPADPSRSPWQKMMGLIGTEAPEKQ